jgi:hypothetical protein
MSAGRVARLALGLGAVALVGAGCSFFPPAPSTRPPSRPPAAAAPATTVGSWRSEPVPSGAGRRTSRPAAVPLTATAVAYLSQRENALFWYRARPTSWLSSVRPLVTRAAYQALAAGAAGASPGFAWVVAHRRHWQVKVAAGCRPDTEARPPTATAEVLGCSVVDRTVTASGKAVPASALPPAWPYSGPQPPALLLMRRAHGRWLVAADDTGRAQ